MIKKRQMDTIILKGYNFALYEYVFHLNLR
jgi:hypothetical protein